MYCTEHYTTLLYNQWILCLDHILLLVYCIVLYNTLPHRTINKTVVQIVSWSLCTVLNTTLHYTTVQLIKPLFRSHPALGPQYEPNPGERFSRKVFVGGLPPDIDEGNYNYFFRIFPQIFSKRNWTPASNYNFLIPIFLPTDGVNLRYSKLISIHSL